MAILEKMKQWKKTQDIASQYRGAPFWAWNGLMKEDEIRRQIRFFKSMGLGGFFMHSRLGLQNEYLSENWFKCIDAAVDEAEKCNMLACLYDEDRYPSGSAGGLVCAVPEYRLHKIFHAEYDYHAAQKLSEQDFQQAVAVYAAKKVSEYTIREIRKLSAQTQLRKDEIMILFTVGEAQKNEWYNGLCYFDPMNPRAVNEFIHITHERYWQRYSQKFGKSIPAIFTDEPHYGFVSTKLDWERETVYSTPWNAMIRDNILAESNYDILNHLCELFYDVIEVKFSRARYDYIKHMSRLFLENFIRNVGEWCNSHNILYTGHVMGEDSLASQALSCGSAMSAYEYMSMPGVDFLREDCRGYLVFKQLSSASRQLGKNIRLCESYGCTGWDFPLNGHKVLGDIQLCCGINFRCQHLALYSMAGEAKRDFPASISYQVPWYNLYKAVEEYFARLHLLLEGSVEFSEILLLSPIESVWSMIRMEFMESENVKNFEWRFQHIMNHFMVNFLDFDLGDEHLLDRYGKVEKHQGAPAELQLGKVKYKIVILPPMITIRATTVKILKDFALAGGTVCRLGDLPEYVDGIHGTCSVDEQLSFLSELDELPEKNFAPMLKQSRKVLITDDKLRPCTAIRHSLRMSESGEEFLFAVNTGYDLEKDFNRGNHLQEPKIADRNMEYPHAAVQWYSQRKGTVYELDALTGEIITPDCQYQDGCYFIKTSFGRTQSRMWVITSEKLKSSPQRNTAMQNPKHYGPGYAMAYELEEDNVLVLDHWQYKFDTEKEWSAKKFIYQIDDSIRNKIKIPLRSNMMMQPWFCAKNSLVAEVDATICLRTEFYSEISLNEKSFLALEEPERYVVWINGKALTELPDGYLIDHAVKRIPIHPGVIRKGMNTIELRYHYDGYAAGLESLYIVGQFGVHLSGIDGILTSLPEKLICGDWTTQGFPFYPGAIRYILPKCRKNEEIKIEKFIGSVAELSSQDTSNFQNQILWCPPYCGTLGDGLHYLRIVGSPRNALGPFFHGEKNPSWCGPNEFKSYMTNFRQLCNYGLYDFVIYTPETHRGHWVLSPKKNHTGG